MHPGLLDPVQNPAIKVETKEPDKDVAEDRRSILICLSG